MGSNSKRDYLAFPCSILLLLLLLFGFGRSDLAQDRAECADILLGLTTCLPYVGGEAKAPTMDCCTGLKQVLDKSKKCLCVLIKDRDDPNLGLNINATLAVHLPIVCHAPANISECADLLHLAPNSPEAKMFEGLAKAEKNSSTLVPSAYNATGGTGSVSEVRSNGGWGKSWVVAEVVCDILPLAFIFHLFFLV